MLEAPCAVACLEPGLSSCVGEGTRALNKATCWLPVRLASKGSATEHHPLPSDREPFTAALDTIIIKLCVFVFRMVGCGLFSSIFTKRTALSCATLTLGCFSLFFQMLESSSVPLFTVFILLFILLLVVLLIRKNGTAALIWNEIIREKVTNFFMNQSKEQRILNFVLQNAVRGDPYSVVDTIDRYCSQKEWAMNVGDEKGNCSRGQHLKRSFKTSTVQDGWLYSHGNFHLLLLLQKPQPTEPCGQQSSSMNSGACSCRCFWGGVSSDSSRKSQHQMWVLCCAHCKCVSREWQLMGKI